MSQNETPPVRALPSATVVVVRDSDRGPELLFVKRRAGDAFGDSYTFPGGVVDDDESNAHALCDGRTAEEADAILNVTEGGLDYYSAAIRELFEETSILVARNKQGEWPNHNAELQQMRVKVDQAKMGWSHFLRELRLRIACDALHYFAHWETPLQLPKRWSTRFFLAENPPGQDCRHDGGELTDSRWLTAAEATARGRDGRMKIPFPTMMTAKTLSKFDSVKSLLDWAQTQAEQGIDRILPVMRIDDDKPRIVLPGDPEYPAGNA